MSIFKEYYTGGKRDCRDDQVIERKYGGPEIPSTVDHPKVDLRMYINRVYDQGKLRICTPTALCSAFKAVMMKQAIQKNILSVDFEPSRLFVYYNSRMYEGTPQDNAAVSVRDTFKALYNEGICQESHWLYDVRKFTHKPPRACYQSALDNRVCRYERVEQHMDQIRACLKAGFPFVFMFELYDSFFSPENEQTGVMPMPSQTEILSENYGLHTVLCVGYDESTQRITVLNSWGESFGDKGYFYMPYAYIVDKKRTGSLWMIEEVCEKSLGPFTSEL